MNIHDEISYNADVNIHQLENEISKQLSTPNVEMDEPRGFQTQGFVFGDVPPKMKSTDYLMAASGWVYACVSAIADAVADLEVEMYQVDKNGDITPINDHPCLDLLSNINKFTTSYDHFWLSQQYLELTGEAPWYVDRGADGLGEPQNLLLLRPDRLKIVRSKDATPGIEPIEEYRYKMDKGNEIKFSFDEVIFLKYPDPLNTFRGKGTLQAAAITVDVDNFSEEYNRRFFYNSARPDSVLTTDQKLTPRQRETLRTDIKRLYQGKENAHKTAILESGLKWEAMTLSQKDMDFLEQQRYTMTKILSIFRVPKSIIAISDDVNLANAKVAEYVFAKRTVYPKLKRIFAQLNEFLLPMFSDYENKFLTFKNPVPIDSAADVLRYDSALGKGWMTINEVRQEQNLEDVGPEGDTIYLPFSLAPLSTIAEPPAPAPAPAPAEPAKRIHLSNVKIINKKTVNGIIDRSAGGYTLALKRINKKAKVLAAKDELNKKVAIFNERFDRIITNMVKNIIVKKKHLTTQEVKNKKEDFGRLFIKTADFFEKKFYNATRNIFENEKKRVLNKLSEKAINADDYLFDEEDEAMLLVSSYKPLVKQVVKEQGDKAGILIGFGSGAFDELTKAVRDYIKNRTFKFSFEITEETNRLLKAQLDAGIKAGEGIPELKNRVANLFDEMSKYRAERIARSEVVRASNFAADEMYRQSGVVESKEWLVTEDDRTCEFCAPLDGKHVGLGNDFFSNGDTVNGADGGSMQIDYEDVGYPPLHANCRCTIIPIIK